MPQRFDKLGISFQYPDNWQLGEEDAVSGAAAVTVYSPEGAFWSVALHPGSADPRSMARAAVDAMREEYPEIDVEEAREDLAGHELVGYDLSFFYLDLTNTARVRCLRSGRSTLTIFCQADDDEFDRLDQVFQAMTVSLLGAA